MALVDMKQTKGERKEDGAITSPGKSGDSGPTYPYGLSVHLDHYSLKKLGMDKLPQVGDKLHLHAHAHVKEVREEHRDGGKKHRHVTLELRHMGVGKHESDDEAKSQSAAKGAKAEMDKALAEDSAATAATDDNESD